jgi:adenine C2-methylase RlmN of 23S rRNA A2503 and tRNA A37
MKCQNTMINIIRIMKINRQYSCLLLSDKIKKYFGHFWVTFELSYAQKINILIDDAVLVKLSQFVNIHQTSLNLKRFIEK